MYNYNTKKIKVKTMSGNPTIVTPRPTNIVRKTEALVRARYSLSQLAIKIITAVISMIDKKDSDLKLYVIKVKDFKELTIGKNKTIGGTAYKSIKDACDELMDKKIEFDDGISFTSTRWLASSEYILDSGEIELEISQKLRPLLVQLKEGKYLNYELQNILPLRSEYIIRLYELLKHEYNKGTQYKGHKTAMYEITIDEFIKEFQVPASYKFNNIKVQILDKAIKQFREHTDIQISYKPSRKKGKKVLAIEFSIKENTSVTPHLKTLRAFILYMRKHFVNKNIIKMGEASVSISENGRVYDKRTLKEYDAKNSQKVWERLYELAQKNNLQILNNVN